MLCICVCISVVPHCDFKIINHSFIKILKHWKLTIVVFQDSQDQYLLVKHYIIFFEHEKVKL